MNDGSLDTENADFGDFVISHKVFENSEAEKRGMVLDSDSAQSDYDDNFAEEYKKKQLKMLGELQSIYDDKSQLTEQINRLTRELSIDDDLGDSAASLMVVETPTSVQNDS